jgi:exodeoxyribonuclease V alpha subunit
MIINNIIDTDTAVAATTNNVTKQLVSLTATTLNLLKQKTLTRIIDELLMVMRHGHSCLSLEDFILKINGEGEGGNLNSVADIINIFIQSGICGTYSSLDQSIPFLPLVILMTDTSSISNTKSSTNIPKNSAKKRYFKSHLLYFARYLYYEVSLSRNITRLEQSSNIPYDLINQLTDKLSINSGASGLPNTEQLHGLKTALSNRLSIITGGPGTGKTTTVTVLLLSLLQLYLVDLADTLPITTTVVPRLRINICAQTGKAAARIKDSVLAQVFNLGWLLGYQELPPNLVGFIREELGFSTIHKLLGYTMNSIHFRHNAKNPLNCDILIIDEVSMISLPLFYKLLKALDYNRIKHVVLLGDKNQLSSVEEGYVFASLIDYFDKLLIADLLNNNIVTWLIQSKRNQGSIAQLAGLVLAGEVSNTLDFLAQGEVSNNFVVSAKEINLSQILSDLFNPNNPISLFDYVQFLQRGHNLGEIAPEELFKHYNNTVVLCFANIGDYGVNNLNDYIDIQMRSLLNPSLGQIWYTGRPIIILHNDYQLGLYNGDIGICVFSSEQQAAIVFSDGRAFIPEVLPHYALAYAITIHKSQGSEYNNVAIVLSPDLKSNADEVMKPQPFVTQELLYTAITRAKSRVVIYSGKHTLAHAITNRSSRQTGLNGLLVNSQYN